MVDVWPIHLTELSVKLNKVIKPPKKLDFTLEMTVACIGLRPSAFEAKGFLRCD